MCLELETVSKCYAKHMLTMPLSLNNDFASPKLRLLYLLKKASPNPRGEAMNFWMFTRPETFIPDNHRLGEKRPSWLAFTNNLIPLPHYANQTKVNKSGKPSLILIAHSLPNNHRTLLHSPCAQGFAPVFLPPLTIKNKCSFASSDRGISIPQSQDGIQLPRSVVFVPPLLIPVTPCKSNDSQCHSSFCFVIPAKAGIHLKLDSGSSPE